MEEMRCGGVAVWGTFDVGELQRSVGELQCSVGELWDGRIVVGCIAG